MECVVKRFGCVLVGLVGLFGPAADLLAEDDEALVCRADFESADPYGIHETLSAHRLLDVVEGEGVDGSHALRATYEGYERGSRRIVSRIDLPKRMTEATLVYDVKFDEGFQFVRSGKLHGLGPDNPVTGGNEMKPDGWSARAVWVGRDGLRTYAYCQNKGGKYGQGPDRKLDFAFETNRYYSVSIHVKLNDPVDQANGSMRIYVNGKGVADHRGIQFRSEDGDHTTINQFLFSTFHGGSSPRFAPKDEAGNYTTVHAYFDNFAVYEGLHVREKPDQP